MSIIQRTKPKRNCLRKSSNYRSFKLDLRTDFNQRCGYCDDIDLMQAGKNFYHIDHFKPHSIAKFKTLKHEYSNLVYSCPFCNGAKSNKWEYVNGFIDPCDSNYSTHIGRKNNGKIIYKTKQGEYIYLNLKLHLKRHELLWMIEKIYQQKKELVLFKNKLGKEHHKYIEILEEFMQCDENLEQYVGLYHKEI